MEECKFNPTDGFRNTTSFPNPTSGTDTRNQFQTPLDQLRDYINTITTLYGTDVIRMRLNTDKSLQYSVDGTNWLDIPMMSYTVVKEW